MPLLHRASLSRFRQLAECCLGALQAHRGLSCGVGAPPAPLQGRQMRHGRVLFKRAHPAGLATLTYGIYHRFSNLRVPKSTKAISEMMLYQIPRGMPYRFRQTRFYIDNSTRRLRAQRWYACGGAPPLGAPEASGSAPRSAREAAAAWREARSEDAKARCRILLLDPYELRIQAGMLAKSYRFCPVVAPAFFCEVRSSPRARGMTFEMSGAWAGVSQGGAHLPKRPPVSCALLGKWRAPQRPPSSSEAPELPSPGADLWQGPPVVARRSRGGSRRC